MSFLFYSPGKESATNKLDEKKRERVGWEMKWLEL
jgi:hypothetical protein